MKLLFFHKIYKASTEKEEMIAEEIRKQRVENEIKIIKKEVECFKRYGLSFVIDDFHRPDGKIIERKVQTDLETYTDKISENEYETGIIEDLDYIDKFKIKFLFPILARRKFDNIEPIKIDEIDNWENPTIVSVTEEEEKSANDILFKSIEDHIKKSKIIHLSDISDTFEIYRKLYEIENGITIPVFPNLYKEDELNSKIIEKLINIDNLILKNTKIDDETINNNKNELEELIKDF